MIERLTLSVRNDRRLAVRLLVEMGEVQERGLYRDLALQAERDYVRAWMRRRIERRSPGRGSRMISTGRQPELAPQQPRGP